MSHARVVPGAKRKNPWEGKAAEAQIHRRYDMYESDMGEAFQHIMGGTEMALRENQAPVLNASYGYLRPIRQSQGGLSSFGVTWSN